MDKSKIESEIKQPLLYVFMMFILSSISYEMYINQKVLTIIIVSAFFIMFILYKKLIVTTIFLMFYILALINNILYYDFKSSEIEEVRVIKLSDYEVLGEVKGRKVELDIDIGNIKLGSKIEVEGTYTSEINTSKGIVGKYTVKKYTELEHDYIYKLYREREAVFNSMSKKIGFRKAALISAMAFGYKEELDSGDNESLREIGVAHAIAVSGLHMALIYGFISKIFGCKIALGISFIYMMFTGASPSTIRAYIMIFIMTFGNIVKRNYSQLSALSLSGIIILLLKPYSAKELGFMLSFLATLGIILFNKKINKKLYKLPNKIRESISLSISTQIFTFPVTILYFNEFSAVFLIGNLIVVPFILMLVVLGNIILVFSRIKIVFNYLLFICDYIIGIIDWILFYFEEVGIGTIYLNYIVVYMYIGFMITYYFYKKGYKKVIFYPVLSIIYVVILVYSPLVNIEYYREGALLITYRGERVIVQTKRKIDEEKIKSICMTNSIKKDVDKIEIGNDIDIKKSNGNYILSIDDKKYILKVNYDKINSKYDIIDFRNGNIQKVIVYGDDIIIR